MKNKFSICFKKSNLEIIELHQKRAFRPFLNKSFIKIRYSCMLL